MNTISIIANIINNNRLNRKVVMRSKSKDFEQKLAKYNINIDFYITKIVSRINNYDCFSDEILKGNSDKYFLILSPEARWNKYDEERYKSFGFKKNIDYIWCSYADSKLNIDSRTQYSDEYGNYIYSLSKSFITINGYCNNIKIGGGVIQDPFNYIKLNGNEHNLIIGDNSVFKPSNCVLETNSSLIIGSNVKIYGLNIYINCYSHVYIGDFSTFQSGKLRTGRNQEVIIGKDCMFSWDIIILGHDGHLIWTIDGKLVNNTYGERRRSIILGNHIWVGGETVILPNTKIGCGTICGYRSLVKGIYPNNCIISGSPAKIIKKNIAWSRQNISFDEKEDFKKIQIEYTK